MPAKHILVVDDDEGVRMLVTDVLSREGFQVTAVTDGAEALALFERQKRDTMHFDLLLTDLDMPRLSGLRLVDALHAQGLTLPTLVMSAKHDAQLMSEVAARGCKGMLRKPFSVQELRRRVNHALGGSAPCAVAR